MLGEIKTGLSTEPVPVSAYAGSSKNLKDLNLKDLKHQKGILLAPPKHHLKKSKGSWLHK